MISEIYAGTGACTLCSCTAFSDDGSHLSRCKCGDRSADHLASHHKDSERELALAASR